MPSEKYHLFQIFLRKKNFSPYSNTTIRFFQELIYIYLEYSDGILQDRFRRYVIKF